MSHPVLVTIERPEWLKEAITSVQGTLNLIAADRIPEKLQGFMIRTAALRLLRCLYGSDLDTAVAIRDHVMESEGRMLEIEQELARQAESGGAR